MQDQAFLGPESGLAVPDGEGGVDLYIATQWLHVDRDQVAASLGLPPEKVRLTLGGVGGAFGGREDLSMQIHACMLALHTGAPGADGLQPRGVVLRPRPPPSVHDALRARRDARRAPGLRARADRPRRRRLRVELDRGVRQRRVLRAAGPTRSPTRASTPTSSTPTTRRAGRCAASAPCRSPSPTRRRWTSSPRRWAWTPSTCGSVNAMGPDSRMPTGAARRRARRRWPSCSSACRAMPMPPDERDGLPGGIANVTHGEGVRRGVGYGVGDQEHRLLGGLRRLLDRARDGCRWRAASRSSRSTPPRPRSARASSPCRPRSRAPSSASSAWRCSTPTPGSARRARARPRARPTSPAAPSRPRARRCASVSRSWRPSAA